MKNYDGRQEERFGLLLDQREADLRALMRSNGYAWNIAGEDAQVEHATVEAASYSGQPFTRTLL